MEKEIKKMSCPRCKSSDIIYTGSSSHDTYIKLEGWECLVEGHKFIRAWDIKKGDYGVEMANLPQGYSVSLAIKYLRNKL